MLTIQTVAECFYHLRNTSGNQSLPICEELFNAWGTVAQLAAGTVQSLYSQCGLTGTFLTHRAAVEVGSGSLSIEDYMTST